MKRRADYDYDRDCWIIPFKRGDRVREKTTGTLGVVHAVWPTSFEDNLEVRLDNGVSTIRDFHRWELVSRLSLAVSSPPPQNTQEHA